MGGAMRRRVLARPQKRYPSIENDGFRDPTGWSNELFRSEGSQFENPAVFSGLDDVTATQRQPHGVEFAGVFGRKIGRPSGVVFDQVDGHFGGIFPLVDQF